MSGFVIQPGSPVSRHVDWSKAPWAKKARPVHVYVVDQLGTDFVKVGIAVNVKSRLNNLRSSNPYPLEISFASAPLDKATAKDVERKAHRFLKGFASSGEWFQCSADVAIGVVKRLLQ